MVKGVKSVESKPSKEDAESEAKQSAKQTLPERKIIAPTKPPESKPTTQQSGNKPERRSWRDEWRHPQVIVNTVLAFITIGIGTIYYFQLQQMKLSTDANKKAADAATIAANSAKQSVEISQRGLELTDKSIELTQRNTELSQRNVELAQKNLDAVQQGLQYASKANEISEKGLETANMPTLDVGISGVQMGGAEWIFKRQTTIEVSLVIQNHSETPAPRVYAQCFLERYKGVGLDVGALNNNSFAVMPRQTVSLHNTIFTMQQHSGSEVLDLINNGKIGIRVYVLFFSSMGKKKEFIKTFYRTRGRFGYTNIEFDPPEKEISDMINQSVKP